MSIVCLWIIYPLRLHLYTKHLTFMKKNIIASLITIFFNSCGSIPPNHMEMPNPVDRIRYLTDSAFVTKYEHEKMREKLNLYPLPALKPDRPLQEPKAGYRFVYRADKTLYGTVFFVRERGGKVTTFSPDGFRHFLGECYMRGWRIYGTE